MDFLKLLKESVPNAGPKSTQQVLDAQQKLEMLRVKNPQEAEIFSKQLAGTITSKGDPRSIFEGISKSYGASLGKASAKDEVVKPQEYSSEELATRIQDAIGLADERNIDLSNSDISRLSSFVAKGDTKKASEQLAKISASIEKSLSIQAEEDKKPQTLSDGTQIEIGTKSGTRYMGGQPVSKGPINSNLFNSLYQKEAEQKQQSTKELGIPIVSGLPAAQMYQTTPIEGVSAQPEVYTKPVQTSPSSIEEKQIAMRKAGEAYKRNDDEEAIVLMNSAGGKGLMGPVTREDLPALFGARDQSPQPTPAAQQSTPPAPPAQPTAQPQTLSSSQQEIFNAVKKANPNVPDEEIIKGLQSKPYFK